MKYYLEDSNGQVSLSCTSENAVECIKDVLEKDVASVYRYEYMPGKFSFTLLLRSMIVFPGVIQMNQMLVFFDTDDGCIMHIVGDTADDGIRETAFVQMDYTKAARGANFHPKWMKKIRDELDRYIIA